jgi:peptidoglycan/xylan/chitin deacetylase (PgdA/CDA1 family)
MTELRNEGFIGERLSKRALEGLPASRPIFITFDDGFRDVVQHALPVLQDCNFRAIQFLVADLIGQTSSWQQESGERPGALMDKSEIKTWLAAGHAIGSHTLRHPFLTRVSQTDAREEIAASKKKLEDLFGVAVDHFCYPYGDYNPVVRSLVKQAEYKTACTTAFGVNDGSSDPFLLQRITARYPSRNWKGVKRWLAGKLLPNLSTA